MKTTRPYPRLIIAKQGTNWAADGHPWLYGAEVIRAEKPDGTPVSMEFGKGEADGDYLENGCIADAVSESGKYIGTGLVSLRSKIRLRLLSRNANDRFDEAFFRRRIRYALDYRKTVMGDDIRASRLIFGEADSFPGLTVDRFENLLSVQIQSYGMEIRKDLLFRLLLEELLKDGAVIDGIFERNDVALRELEGLTQYKGWYEIPGRETPASAVTEILENGIRYTVDVENGQKTGFFLDQKYNRLAVARLSEGKTVLDCFTHTGSFALNAAKGNARHVTAVDISESAIEMARANAELNGLADRMDFVCADVFDLLPELINKGTHPYDFIILDPPAFTKSRKTVKNAEKGYKEINLRALKLLPRGGYLATASCSHFMEPELFVKMMKAAALDAGVELRQIEERQQAPDHPILWSVPETNYLKFYIFQVV